MKIILLKYDQNGATSIRLDAIGFLWKESGTSCIHLPQTHAIIQAWRLLLDYFKVNTQIITETNVPHLENISYFGKNDNEAHMVYQFTLPPLVLFTLSTHNFEGIKTLVEIRKNESAFSPFATQKVLNLGSEVFALERYSEKIKALIVKALIFFYF